MLIKQAGKDCEQLHLALQISYRFLEKHFYLLQTLNSSAKSLLLALAGGEC